MLETDLQLLARYTREHAEDAFAKIVRRHLDLVFSAALRQVRSPQLAEEVAQSVFTKLARQANGLAPDTILTGAQRRLVPFRFEVSPRQLDESLRVTSVICVMPQ